MAQRTTTTSGTVVGVFEDRRRAEEAIAELERAGFKSDQIGFVTHGDASAAVADKADRVTTDTGPGSGALSGALTGGVIGGVLGALAALAIPGVGPVVAAGILGPVLGGAAAGAGLGAAGGGIIGGLVTTGVAEEDARYYDSEFRGGRSLVTVKAGSRADEARTILQRFGAYDSSRRMDRGATATTASTSQTTSRTREREDVDTSGRTIRVPEVEERLDVEKREVQKGEVRIKKHVEERQETIPVTLEREEVHVDRRDVAERPIAPGERVEAFKEETLRVPVRAEEAVVNKEAVVTGEVVLNKDRTAEQEHVSDTVRRTRVEVDKSDTTIRPDDRTRDDRTRR